MFQQRVSSSVQQRKSNLSHEFQIASVRVQQFVSRAAPIHHPVTSLDHGAANSGLYPNGGRYPDHLDDENGESRYVPHSSREQIAANIYKDLDTQGFNGPVALLAALEYLASWCSLFAINLATTSLDFIYSDAESDVLGSGVISSLPVLVGMSAGMLASGQLVTLYGSKKISPLFLSVLLFGSIGTFATSYRNNTYLILLWQIIMGIGIGSSVRTTLFLVVG